MSVISLPIIPAKVAEAAQTTQYTSPQGTRTIVDKFTATNVSASPATLSVHLVASGGAAGDANLIVKTKTLAAGECYTFPELVGHTLGAGDIVSTLAGTAAAITIRASGRQVTA